LQGKEWQFGLTESVLEERASGVPDFVVLRPWDERQRPLSLNYANPESFAYTKRLFFGGHSYELDCRYVAAAAAPKYQVTFNEQSPELGELNVSGASLHRVILTAKRSFTLILDKPQGPVKVPVGTYAVDEIWLQKGDENAGSFRAGNLVIDAQRPATLTAGGPLTNSVVANAEGQALELNYKLLGADGRGYQFPSPDYQHPPEFAVFQGTNRLASGSFQYG
jgi:hypothetical protein